MKLKWKFFHMIKKNTESMHVSCCTFLFLSLFHFTSHNQKGHFIDWVSFLIGSNFFSCFVEIFDAALRYFSFIGILPLCQLKTKWCDKLSLIIKESKIVTIISNCLEYNHLCALAIVFMHATKNQPRWQQRRRLFYC